MRFIQIIRLIDVFYIGIFLIYVATKFSLPTPIKIQLIILGVATILYNGYQFLSTYQVSENKISVVSSPIEPIFDMATETPLAI